MKRLVGALFPIISLLGSLSILILYAVDNSAAISSFLYDRFHIDSMHSYPRLDWEFQNPSPSSRKLTISTVGMAQAGRTIDTGVSIGIYEPLNPPMIGPDRQTPQGAAWYSRIRGQDRVMNFGGLQFAHWSWIVTFGDPSGRQLAPQFRGRERLIVIPYWLISCITLILPIRAAIQLMKAAKARRLRRMNITLCENCGYDLRATTERCPECGEANTRSNGFEQNR